MSTQKIKEDNAYTVPGKVAIDKYDATSFQKAIKAFFEKHKTATLKRIENTGGAELYDLDITIELPKDSEGEHAQVVRETGTSLVHELKQEFWKYLQKEGFKTSTMSVRGQRTNGNLIETTISLTLPNSPMIHRDHVERVQNLIESVLTEATTKI